MKKTLEKLPACENLPEGQGLLRQLGRSSRQLPNASISVQVVQPTGRRVASPIQPIGTLGDFTDPQFLNAVEAVRGVIRSTPGGRDIDTIEDPFFGPNPQQAVVDERGKITVQRKVPLDLNLVEALKGESSIVGELITRLSQGIAAILPTGHNTISAMLADSGDTTIAAVHLGLALPIIKALPGPVSNQLVNALKTEADVQLAQGNIADLEESVRQLDKGFDIPFISTTSKKEQEVIDRVRGNLEILKIQEQEEF